MDKIIIINFIEKPISFTNFLNFNVSDLNIDKTCISEIENELKDFKFPKIRYYDFDEEKKKNKKGVYYYNFHELDSDFITKIIKQSDIIMCLSDNIKKTKEFIEDINKKCVTEFFRENDHSLFGFLITLKTIYFIDVKYIYIHF